jgi:hypothetical protein
MEGIVKAMAKTSIVITSIFAPTPAVELFAGMAGHRLIVVGDRKSPADWRCPGATFLSVRDQEGMDGRLSRVLPFNHYCRKMLGYVHAYREGAEVIIDTDDDNIPSPGWAFPAFSGQIDAVAPGRGFVNVYSLFTDQVIWPRGLPLSCILSPHSRVAEEQVSPVAAKVGVWQGLADGDPDVDAVYRLCLNQPCVFRPRQPIVLSPGTVCPFNSQNTAFCENLFPLMYLPAHVTFRFTDILRSLVAQPIMWEYGYRLGFSKATVRQVRNAHDYFKDFQSEIPMYLHAERVVEIVGGAIGRGSIADRMVSAYEALCRASIVPAQELEVLAAWLADIGQ